MSRPETIEMDKKTFRLHSKWQDVWGDWQFWWQSRSKYSTDEWKWENIANGDKDWAERMSNHYKIKITGEYTNEQE